MLRNPLPALRNRSEETLRPVSISDMMEEFWRSPFGAPSLLDEMTRGFFGGREAYPAVNVSEGEKEVKIEAELPGLEAKDVDIRLENGAFVISGEKKFEDEEKKDSYHRIERSYGRFTRAVPLPCEVNEAGVKAKFEKGVLRVVLPKAHPGEPKRSIKIEE